MHLLVCSGIAPLGRSTTFSYIACRSAAPPTRRFPWTGAPDHPIFRPTSACEAGIEYAAHGSFQGLVPQSLCPLECGFVSPAMGRTTKVNNATPTHEPERLRKSTGVPPCFLPPINGYSRMDLRAVHGWTFEQCDPSKFDPRFLVKFVIFVSSMLPSTH